MGFDSNLKAVGTSGWAANFPWITALVSMRERRKAGASAAVEVVNNGCSRTRVARVCEATEPSTDWTTQYTEANRICSLEKGFGTSYNFKNSANVTIGSLFLYPDSITIQLFKEPSGSPLKGNFIIARKKNDGNLTINKLLSHLREHHSFEITKSDLDLIKKSVEPEV